MACYVSCSISLIFIIGMIYFYYMTSHSKIVKEYKKKLPPELKTLYEKIVQERTAISYRGYALGILISWFIIYYNIKFKHRKLNNLSLVCIVTATAFFTNYFYYILSPKKYWMLEKIDCQELANHWLKMYREMQFNYHMGLVFGILAVSFFAFAFRC